MSNAKKQRRIRRSPEQMIADLQEQIKSVKARAAAKELKTSPAIKKATSALRALDKGMELAHDEGNSLLHNAMADCRRTLGEFLEKQGMRLPKARMPRGRKPKAE
jgi:hypothetical protein